VSGTVNQPDKAHSHASTAAQVSNSSITQEEYNKAKERAARSGAKFITKGDVQQALDKLQHARRWAGCHYCVKCDQGSYILQRGTALAAMDLVRCVLVTTMAV
jgi:hypothetical protein